MSQLETIKQSAERLRAARDLLDQRMQLLKDEIEEINRKHMKGIMLAADNTTKAHDDLHILVKVNPELFAKPRTQIFHGIKVGYAKGKGVLKLPANIVEAIRKKMPSKFSLLIKTEEKPVAKALSNLSVAELKTLGATVTNTGDQVVIKHTVSTDLDKLVDGFLKEAEQYREE